MATTTIIAEGSLHAPEPHAATAQPHLPGHYLSWGAIVAGALCAAAISLVLFTFGSAVGLSALSPWPNMGLSTTVAVIIAAIWAVLVQIVCFAVGGYVAGRVRNSWGGVVPHERRFRDGMHGLLVWTVGVLIMAALAAIVAGGLFRLGVQATATVGAGTLGGAAASASREPGPSAGLPEAGPSDRAADFLLRPSLPGATAPAGGAPPAGTEATPAPAGQQPLRMPNAQELRPILVRMFSDGLEAGALAPADRTYLASLIVLRTGVPQADAEQRVDQAFAEAKAAEAKVRDAADKARKASVLAGFLAAATLAVGCAAACAGATLGGRHRDDQTEIRLFGTRYFW